MQTLYWREPSLGGSEERPANSSHTAADKNAEAVESGERRKQPPPCATLLGEGPPGEVSAGEALVGASAENRWAGTFRLRTGMGGERWECEIGSDFRENTCSHINRARNQEKGTPKLEQESRGSIKAVF